MWSVWNHPSVTWLQRARATTMYSVTQSHPRVEPARPRLFERYHDRRPTDRVCRAPPTLAVSVRAKARA